jgi:hypothetical protein
LRAASARAADDGGARAQAVVNNIIETRVDATKLCTLTRRPEPRGAYDIGTRGCAARARSALTRTAFRTPDRHLVQHSQHR